MREAVTRLYQRAAREMLELMEAVVSERIFLFSTQMCKNAFFKEGKNVLGCVPPRPFCSAEIPSESLVKLVETVTIPSPAA